MSAGEKLRQSFDLLGHIRRSDAGTIKSKATATSAPSVAIDSIVFPSPIVSEQYGRPSAAAYRTTLLKAKVSAIELGDALGPCCCA